MSSRDHNNPPGKPGQRSRKAKPASKKPDHRQRPKRDQQPDRQLDDKELIQAAVASPEIFPIESEASTGTSLIETAAASTETPETPLKGALVPIEAVRIGTVVSLDTFWGGFQTIANAYGDYIRKSLDETRSLLEKLSVVRSPDKAIEVQTEFAKQAFETFLSDSHRISKLYSELARHIFRPFERLATRMSQPAR
jgi:phasin family protein